MSLVLTSIFAEMMRTLKPLFCFNTLLSRRLFSSKGFDKRVNPSQYCLDSVRKNDHEHFLSNLLLPHQLRAPAFAIRALSVEIAGVRDAVSETTIGLMRLQFWNDTIDKLYDDKHVNHPVAMELHRVIKQFNPQKELFHKLISSRDCFLGNNPFDSLEDVEAYGENAFSSVYLFLLDCAGSSSQHSKTVATQLGKCEGLVTLLRAAPHNAARRRVYLPTQLMMEHDVSVEQVIRGKDMNELEPVIETIASRAQTHLDSCRFRMKYLSKEDKLVMLPSIALDNYLDKLSKAKCNVFEPKLQLRNSWLPMSLYWHKFKQTY